MARNIFSKLFASVIALVSEFTARILREMFGSRFFSARPEVVEMTTKTPPIVIYPYRKLHSPIPAANREGSAFHSDVDDNGGEL
jgi:hypothetical protein